MNRTYSIIISAHFDDFEDLVTKALKTPNTQLVGGVAYDGTCLVQAILTTEIEPLTKD